MSGDGKSTAFSLVRLSCCWWSALRRLLADLFEKIVSHAILTTNSGKEKKCYFFCFEANY